MIAVMNDLVPRPSWLQPGKMILNRDGHWAPVLTAIPPLLQATPNSGQSASNLRPLEAL
jgi:hypothetical protein